MSAPRKASLDGQVRAGVAWTGLATIGQQLVTLAAQLILARLLLPEAFGLIGMAVVFTGLIQVMSELGVSAALVQRREEDLTADHLDAAFWTGMASSGAAVLLCAGVLGPLAAWFYGEPVLWGVVTVISLSLLFRAVNSVDRALLTRSMRFRALGAIGVGSAVIGGAGGVLMALAGFAVWSIAWLGVITAGAAVPMYWLAEGWRPRFRFSIPAFKDVFGFGAFVSGYQVILFLGKNLDYLLIGRFVGASALGAYTLAFVLTNTFRRSVMGILNQVMYPVYGKLQDSPAEAKRYYLQAIRVNTLLAFPILAFLMAFPNEFVTLLFGPQWADAGFPLRMLALAMMVHTAGGTSASVIRGLGHVRLQFWVDLVRVTLFTFPMLVVGLGLGGMHGVAVAVVGSKLGGRMVGQYFMKRLIHVSELDVIRTVGPAAIGAGLVLAVGWLIHTMLGGPTTVPGLVLVGALVLLPPAAITYRELKPELAALRGRIAPRAAP